jgi:phytoene synthase
VVDRHHVLAVTGSGGPATSRTQREAAVALEGAYRQCARIAREHYENFPVASWLLPREARRHVAAIYAFARAADDLADEGSARPEQRLAGLARWRAWLHDSARRGVAADAGPHAPVFLALGDTMRVHRLDVRPFDDLLDAFAQDVVVTRYASWNDLLEYCRRSANPIGRLVLAVCGYAGLELERASDCVCTALQLTNFWQDLARDWAAGRLYVPEDVQEASGATRAGFDPAALTPEWRAALARAAARTRDLFVAGRAVCDDVSGRLRYELRLTWLGGMQVLERLEQNEFDTVRRRPSLRWTDAAPLLWRLFAWR